MLLMWACVEEETGSGRFDDDTSVSSSGGAGTGGVTSAGGMGGSTTSSSTGTGASTSTGGSGGDCVNDSDEPNHNEANAVYLGMIEDDDSQTFRVDAKLANNDVDWWYYDGEDTFGYQVDATVSAAADGQIQICQYAECPSVTFTCPVGSSDDVSPDGRAGCCTTEVSLSYSPNCAGSSDDATIYLRITKPSGFTCVTYSLDIHY